MNFRTNFLIVIIICLSLLLNSCGKSNQGANIAFDYRKGTDGIELSFPKSFPKDIIEGEKMYATFTLKNLGASDTHNGIIVPSIETDFLEITGVNLPVQMSENQDKTVIFNSKGKTMYNPNGDIQIASYIIKAKEIDDTRNKIYSKILLSACYPYETVLSETICIDTDIEGKTIAKKTCEAKDLSLQSQGAPVAITKVEQRILPTDNPDTIKIDLSITAENKGKGMVIDNLRYKDICLGQTITKQDYNKILLTHLTISDYEYNYGEESVFECNPNPIQENNGKYFTKCTLKNNQGIPKKQFYTFQAPLVINIIYGYKTLNSQEIEILNTYQINTK